MLCDRSYIFHLNRSLFTTVRRSYRIKILCDFNFINFTMLPSSVFAHTARSIPPLEIHFMEDKFWFNNVQNPTFACKITRDDTRTSRIVWRGGYKVDYRDTQPKLSLGRGWDGEGKFSTYEKVTSVWKIQWREFKRERKKKIENSNCLSISELSHKLMRYIQNQASLHVADAHSFFMWFSAPRSDVENIDQCRWWWNEVTSAISARKKSC